MLKRTLVLCFFLGCLTATWAQSDFPKAFIGNWKGEVHWTRTGSSEAQTVAMELRIQPSTDSVGQYTWNLIYGKANEDNRPYLLQPVNQAQGHWRIDERNGILLDQYWVAGKFVGSFTVQTTTITNSYWLEDGKLLVEFISSTATPVNSSGAGNAESPTVLSYGIKSYQKAILSKAP